jgi:hypothetical protein
MDDAVVLVSGDEFIEQQLFPSNVFQRLNSSSRIVFCEE